MGSKVRNKVDVASLDIKDFWILASINESIFEASFFPPYQIIEFDQAVLPSQNRFSMLDKQKYTEHILKAIHQKNDNV